MVVCLMKIFVWILKQRWVEGSIEARPEFDYDDRRHNHYHHVDEDGGDDYDNVHHYLKIEAVNNWKEDHIIH